MSISFLKKTGALSIFGLLIFLSTARANSVQIEIAWKYKNFDPKLQVFDISSEKAPFVSETEIVKSLSQTPASTPVRDSVAVEANSSKSLVLVLENKSDKDLYFFAVPHEVHPATASAGHFFECLCVGRVFKVPKKSVWYRIVRLNLNSSFQNLKKFKVEHQIIGLTEKEANSTYADRLYNYK